ncbi:MAG TPA: hypothetical protein VFI11_14025 [Anaerolineales bacterium]|nr:hypothetical protein [Anaerolineales bacterium]
MVARLRPGIRVEGRLPDLSSAGWLLLANHYSRRDFKSWWISWAVSSLIAREVHWIMTSALTFPDRWRSSTLTPLSAWALPRLAACYGFTSMPPMPPRHQDVEARAHAVRQVLKYIFRTRDPLVGLTPEGGDSPDGGLQPLWPGAGRFLQLLAHSGLRFLPIGVYESDDQLCVNIGEPFVPPLPSRRSAEEQDTETEQVVMHQLAACLPVDLRGSFAS